MVHQPGGCLHAGRELLVKRESPGCLGWEPFPLPYRSLRAPMEQKYLSDPSPGQRASWCPRRRQAAPFRVEAGCLRWGSAGTWLIMTDTQSGTTTQKTETIQGSPDTTGLGIYNNVIAPPSPKTCQAGDSLRPAASWWWAAANCYAPFKCTPACSAGKLPILSSHKQSRFGRIKGGGAACESF